MLIARVHRRRRFRRAFVIPLALGAYCYFLLLDAQHFFARLTAQPSIPGQSWILLGFSGLTALLFLAVGMMVWLAARTRPVAWLLFAFCLAMMVSFTVSSAAYLNDPVLSALGSISSGMAVLTFSILVLYFPHDFVASIDQRSAVGRWTLHGYRAVMLSLGLLSIPAYAVVKYLIARTVPAFLDLGYHSFFLLAVVGIIATMVAAYRGATTPRKRQQLRLFAAGVILALTPALVLTVLPSALSLPPQYVVNSQLSTISVVLLPLTLGYSTLRYQIMLLDSSVRRVASWLVGGLGMGMLVYLVLIAFNLFHGTASISIVVAVIVAASGGVFVWRGMQRLTDRFFFAEQAHFNRVIENADLLAAERLDTGEVARLLAVAAARLFDTQTTCLFVLDAITGRYGFVPTAGEEDAGYADQQALLQLLFEPQMTTTIWLEEQHPLIRRLVSAKRPFLLNDAHEPAGLARYLAANSDSSESDPLIVPIRATGTVIGMLVAGVRTDRQPYAGPEIEACTRLQARIAPVLETARLYDQANRRTEIMNALYSGIRPAMLESAEALMTTYADMAAEAFHATAGFWLLDEAAHQLQRGAHHESGPRLVEQDCLANVRQEDLHPYFSSRSQALHPSTGAEPTCLRAVANRVFPYAWLPLEVGDGVIGVFTLVFASSHYFTQEEQRDLVQLAGKCAAEIERANMTVALFQALERQKELDVLKDQFIMTASHELRTPLTAVQGYLELLNEFGANLDEETRAQFLATARRSCEELVLMVENIMNAGTLQTGAIPFTIEPLRLEDPVKQVIEILNGNFDREGRAVRLDVPGDLLVLGDQMRLRQVFLNLLTNALKYSPSGSPLDIVAVQESADALIVRVRDHGAGVPQQQHEAIFEPFVRLERDMNSPVRGAGLGLSLCKQLVEGMGGRIWVESSGEPGNGSTFCFTLKMAPRGAEGQQGRLASVGQG
jgi:signal transduction histidine kinase